MSGVCKYCGFSGSNEAMADHAGECLEMMHEPPALLAWDVEVNGLCAVAYATTRAKARWQAVKAYWAAGYGHRGEWPNVQARRCVRMDYIARLRTRPGIDTGV